MRTITKSRTAAVAAFAITGMLAGPVFAQNAAENYPSKPVRIVASTGVGGDADVQGRLFAAKLSESFGKQFIVDNHPGMILALPIVAKAAPDGYTLLTVLPEFTSVPALYKSPPADPIKDFVPISIVSRAPFLLTVNPSVPVNSVRELIALAKAQPGTLNFGGGLPGSGTHFVSMWFLSVADIKATYVPYKGGVAQSTVELLAGQIQAGFSTGTAITHVKSGRLRALGVGTLQRSIFLPDIPTIAEQGVTGFDASTFHGFAAPAGTPAAIVNKLSTELNRIAKSPDIVEKLKAYNTEPVGSTPEQFRQLIAVEVPRWKKVADDAGITAN